MNFIIKNQEIFKTDSSVRNINTGTSTLFTDQMPTCLVFKKVHFMLASKFSTEYRLV